MRVSSALLALVSLSCGAPPIETLPARGPAARSPPPTPVDADDDSVGAAQPLEFGSDIAGLIDEPGDHDFYAVNVTGPTLVRVRALGSYGFELLNDPFVRVLDGNGDLVDENDDSRFATGSDNRFRVNSDLITAVDGPFFVEIFDASEIRGDVYGGPNAAYHLFVEAPDADGTIGVGGADPVALTNVLHGPLDSGAELLAVGFAPGANAHRFTLPVLDAGSAWGFFAFARPDALRTTIVDDTGAILARSSEPILLRAPLAAGALTLVVDEGTAGGSPVYIFRGFPGFGAFDAVEQEDPDAPGANDLAAGAEPMSLDDAFIVTVYTRISTLTDVDRFAVQRAAGATMSAECTAQAHGSGVRGLQIEWRDANDAVLDTATESTTEAAIATATASAAGAHQLVLSKAAQDAVVVGDHVLCEVRE